MSTANKRKGATWETTLLKWFREAGYPAERLRLAGARDEGDLAVQEGPLTVVVEAKAEKSYDLPRYMREARAEADNYAKARGLDLANVLPVAIVKRRNQPVEKAFVVVELGEWFTT